MNGVRMAQMPWRAGHLPCEVLLCGRATSHGNAKLSLSRLPVDQPSASCVQGSHPAKSLTLVLLPCHAHYIRPLLHQLLSHRFAWRYRSHHLCLLATLAVEPDARDRPGSRTITRDAEV